MRQPGEPGVHASLLLFPGALGDAVCFEPTVAHFAALGSVTLYARGGAAEVAQLFPAGPALRSLDAPEIARLFAASGEGDPPAWLEAYQSVISFTGSGMSAFRDRLEKTGRAVVAGFPRGRLDLHASDYFLRAATRGERETARSPRLIVPETARTSARARLDALERPILMSHPGSGGQHKRAPQALFAALFARWRNATGGSIVVVLGPAEESEVECWRRFANRVIVPADITELAALMVCGDVYLGNDSGPSHVAAALGTVGVAMFLANHRLGFAPRGARLLVRELGPPGERGEHTRQLELAWTGLQTFARPA